MTFNKYESQVDCIFLSDSIRIILITTPLAMMLNRKYFGSVIMFFNFFYFNEINASISYKSSDTELKPSLI